MERTLYYRLPSGAVGSLTETVASEDQEVPLPAGAVELTAEEYATARAAVENANMAAAEERRASEEAAKREAYDALIGLGLADGVARTVSGYRATETPGG